MASQAMNLCSSILFLVGFVFVFTHQSSDDQPTHYVLNGGDIKINCIPEEMSKGHDPMKFKWIRKGLYKLGANIAIDKDGSLSLTEAVIQNTDEYQCHASSADREPLIFTHVIVVFDIPILSEEVLLSYRAFRCKPHIEKEKLEIVRKALCGRQKRAICPLRLSSFCENKIFKDIRVEHRLKIFIINTVPRYFTTEKCKNDEKCASLRLRKLFRKYQHKMNHFIRTEIESAKIGSEFLADSVIRFEKDVVKRHTQVGCAGGYKLDKGDGEKFKVGTVVNKLPRDHTLRCIPCSPGTYSVSGDILCRQCHHDTYQDGFGHSACKNCPKGNETEGYGTKTILDCLNHKDIEHRRYLHRKSVQQRKSIFIQEKLKWKNIWLGCTAIVIVFVITLGAFIKNKKTVNLLINYDAGDGQKKNKL